MGLCGLLAAFGCTGKVHDLSVTASPLVILRGHVDTTSVARRNPNVPLLGALVWAGLPRTNPVCLKFDVADLKAACPDPYGMFYGQIEQSVAIDAQGNFDLPLYYLPKASVSVGDAMTRIAYGSLVVAEDVDGDGQLTFPNNIRGSDAGQGEDPNPADNHPPTAAPAPPTRSDTVIAATFSSLHTAQLRVVFREGGFVVNSNFYPAPGCAAPPPGFSIQSAPPLGDTPPTADPCTFSSTETRVEVPSLSPDEAQAFVCRPLQRGQRVLQPRQNQKLPKDMKAICLSPQILATVTMGSCPRVSIYALKGCRQDVFCLNPEWDLSASPPDFWPCR